MPWRPLRYTDDLIKEYFTKKYWNSDTTTSLWNYNARVYPDDEAYVEKDRRFTWKEVNLLSDTMAQFFSEIGFQKDDLLFVLLPNITESYAVRVAAEKVGVICCTALMTLGENEISHIIKQYKPVGITVTLSYRSMNYYDLIERNKKDWPSLKYVLYLDEDAPNGAISLRKSIQETADKKAITSFAKPQIDATEVSVIALTSGTTGLPKAVEHAQCGRMSLAKAYGFRQLELRKEDVVLNVVSAVAGFGCAFCYNGSTALVGAKNVILDRWTIEDTLELIQRERVTLLLAVPAQYAQLVKYNNLSKYDLSSLRAMSSSTGPLPADVAKEVEVTFGIPIVNTYGALDGGIIAQTTIRHAPYARYNTVGTPPEGMIVKLIDDNGNESKEGEIVYSGPTTVGGYYKDYESTINAWGAVGLKGIFKSGDLGIWDNEGNLKIIGRKKNVIIRGGQNIYPIEIEGLLMMHPKIKEVAIVPMTDKIMGEKACAYVVTFDGTSIDLNEIIEYLKSKNIARYKFPERLEIMSELPKIQGNKIDIKKLKQVINEKIKTDV